MPASIGLARFALSLVISSLLSVTLAFCGVAEGYQDPSVYEYRSTRDLVSMVNDAAALFAQEGEKAFEQFSRPGSRWLHDNTYLFVYEMSGVCAFHPIRPREVGQNQIGAADCTGKPVVKMFLETAGNDRKPYGWVHYHDPPPQSLFPLWKCTYVVGVRDPSGKLFALGSGRYNMRMEKLFIVDLVDRASHLIARKGADAFPEILDPAGPFVFADTYVYVLSPDGDLKVDPNYPHGPLRNALDFKDARGRLFIRDMLERIKGKTTAWGMYMWPKPRDLGPSKKLMYLRRVESNGQTYLVGSNYFMASPVWMP